jgi:hypothetical protein
MKSKGVFMKGKEMKQEKRGLMGVKMKWLFALFFALIVTKWVVLDFLPSSTINTSADSSAIVDQADASQNVPSVRQPVMLSIDLDPVRESIEEEYLSARKDIEDFVAEQMERQKQDVVYRLTEDDGFLDWLFGWWTGYKMLWKKIKGLAGSDDNEVAMVSKKFQEEVMKPGLDRRVETIYDYAKNRVDDYQKSVLVLTRKYLNKELQGIKSRGYTHVEVKQETVPWGNYIVQGGTDGFALVELTGVTSISVIAGKAVGAKVGAVLGPKMLGLLTAKASSVVAGKVAAAFSLFLAPLVDYGLNEATRAWKYEDTKNTFASLADNILEKTRRSIRDQLIDSLDTVKETLYSEVGQNLIVKGEK